MYLRWTKTHVPDLQFKACGGEKKVIGGVDSYRYLDGYSAETLRAYEFLGCFWHGCPTCYPNNRDAMVPRLGKSFAAAYEEVTYRRDTILRLNPTTVHSFTEIWEHEWRNQVKDNTDAGFAAFVENFKDNHPPPIVERDALFGGEDSIHRMCHCITFHSLQAGRKSFAQPISVAMANVSIARSAASSIQMSLSSTWTLPQCIHTLVANGCLPVTVKRFGLRP